MRSSLYKFGLGLLAAGAACLLADAWYLERYFFQVKRCGIGKMGSRNSVRIVFLSDLHFKKRLWPFHHRLIRKINALRPDLLLLAGDVIDVHGRPAPAREFFRRLNFSLPKLVIAGNHDHKNGVSRKTLRKIVEQHNGRLLVNETVRVTIRNAVLTVTGLDDFIEGESCFADAVKAVGKEENHLLLVHSPLQQEKVLKELQIINAQRTAGRQLALQYIFAGHTHGGQVRWKPFVPVLPKKSGGMSTDGTTAKSRCSMFPKALAPPRFRFVLAPGRRSPFLIMACDGES